jgi:hypothetical protein
VERTPDFRCCLHLEALGPAPLRRCEKIENRENSPLQVVDYQWVRFAFLGLSPIFSHLLIAGVSADFVAMKISRDIWDFMKFASLTFVATGGIGALWRCHLRADTFYWWLGAVLCLCFLLLTGILGMVWSLVEWFVSGVAGWRRARAPHGKDLSRKESSGVSCVRSRR